ncbi:ImmA/IrrE family metallo-endopeptidase [Streptomyces sp. NPDC057681]|uniref:ImmA/IrrE family metallo-endopeptidase n=1 Tax=Streptomyces sp. NPDC057681 TaxID=3346209 RepID=UPI003684A1D7
MVVRVRVEPALLRWAVDRAGWTEETIAQRAPRLDAWLADNARPTLKQLERFAHSTHTPLGLLFLSEPPDEPMPIPDMRTLGNRAITRPSVDLLDTIYACQSRQDWYRDYATNNGLPGVEFVGSADVSDSPERVATQVRSALKFDLPQRAAFNTWEEALRKLIDRIEGIGILVMVSGIVGSDTHRTLNPEEFRGFALVDSNAPLIFINGADTKAAQIFTMVHELAHVWLGESALSDAPMARHTENAAELWCNQVAAEVLVPLASIRHEYRGQLSVSELERLARTYRVSTLVILKRLHDAHFLAWDEYQARYEVELERVIAALTERRGSSGGGNYYYTQPIRLSRQFARAVIADTFEGKTPYRDAYHLLGTKKHQTFQNLVAEIGAA